MDAQTWLGFEQRIQERRFRALLETIESAVVARNHEAARAALDEARELRPFAPELKALTARVAALPAARPEPAATTFLPRALSAAGMLVVGVTLILGIEWMRPERPRAETPASSAVSQATLSSSAAEVTPAPGAPVTPLTASAARDEAGPVAEPVVAPAPASPALVDESGEEAVGTAGLQRASMDAAGAVPNRTTFRTPVSVAPSVAASGEVPDDYVAESPRRESYSRAGSQGPVTAPPVAASVTRPPLNLSAPIITPAPIASTNVPAAAAAATAAAIASRAEETRVAQVLNQYARAYGSLNASAARAVWPSVDERALARAFSGLESQNVSFDRCDINVNGATANASCRGTASYVGKVGSREAHTEPREWTFELKRDGSDWTIANAEARRLAYDR